MLKIDIFAIGNRLPSWVSEGVEEYTRRLPKNINLNWNHFRLQSKNGSKNAVIARNKQGEKFLAAIPSGSKVIALDERGDAWSSKNLANTLSNWMFDSEYICILIGGPDGLSPKCLERADHIWSLAPITLPHFLVRIILVEQLYRACSINLGHPYHRE